jgi:D-sedoheptulose 7-phosphate isomerase
MQSVIRAIFEDSIETKRQSLAITESIAMAGQTLISCLQSGGKILVCGNGGSAADAQHFAAELIGRFERERAPWPCLALTTDTSLLTAWSNDDAFESVFARQIRAFGQRGDVLVCISTSGNSANVLAGMEEARRLGMQRIALSGKGGGKLGRLPGVHQVVVPSENTARIQEVHITIIHTWCALIDQAGPASEG